MITSSQAGTIRLLWNEGKSVEWIARISGVPPDNIYDYVRRHRDECPPRRKSKKKLDWEDVTFAWYEVEKRKTPVREVAEMFGVTTTTIYRWVDLYWRKKWEDADN